MDQLSTSEHIETSMEYMKFCTHVINKEMERFNLDFTVYQSFVTQLPGVLDVNFDIAYNRCAFMYKYTLCNMYFLKDCMNKFLLEYMEFKDLVSKWAADSNAKLCSLSCGPGLDYLSFMLTMSDQFSLPAFKNVTILSKHGAWRNTVGIVADALEEGYLSKSGNGKLLNYKNIEVIQTNLLASIPMKGSEALQQSSVILMVKTLNLTAPGLNEEENIKTKLLALISSLKLEATIFFIDTKPSLTLFLEVLSQFHGQFLYKPSHLSFRVPVTFSEVYKEQHGCFPVVCARGAFFVWQKLSSFGPDPILSISPLNIQTDVKEISQNSLENAMSVTEEVLNITKTLKELILPNKNLEHNSVGNIVDSCINDVKESVSITSSLFDSHKQLVINKSSSIQTLSNIPSFQEVISEVNFGEKNCSSHCLKKSSSIDNSFLQGSSKKLFLGKSDLLQNYPSHTQTSEEIYPTNFPHYSATNKKINENNNNIALKSNQSVKPILESKATQTEIHLPISTSIHIKDLTKRVKRLISSLEKVQKNIPDDQINHHLQENSKINTNDPSCPTNGSNNSDEDVKPQCCNGYKTEGENLTNCCSYAPMHHAHCCIARHNMVHACELHCCRTCVPRCHINSYKASCENNIASSSSVQPQIVIPLQNVNNDILLQLILASKSGSEFQ